MVSVEDRALVDFVDVTYELQWLDKDDKVPGY